MTAPATMQSEAMWGYHPLAGERSGAHDSASQAALV